MHIIQLYILLFCPTLVSACPTNGADESRSAAADLSPLVQLLGQVDDPAFQKDVLEGMHQALAGRRTVEMPKGWPGVYRKLSKSSSAEIRETATALAVIFGDPRAIAAVRRIVSDKSKSAAARQSALGALVQKRSPELVPLLFDLLADSALRGAALRGLAAYNHKATPNQILGHYRSLTDSEKRDAVSTLTSRPAYALALLDAIEHNRVARRDLSTFDVRNMIGFEDERINRRLRKVWGSYRPISRDKTRLIAQYKLMLAAGELKKADRSHGRFIFSKTCAACHRLFETGGNIGPDLTGSQRSNLDYVLQNLIDPNAIVGRDFQMTVIQTENGRIITGLIKSENAKTLTVQTTNDVVKIPKEEIEVRKKSPLSMMPEGLLEKLSRNDVRDLVAYLASPRQVPLPENSATTNLGEK